MACPTDLNETEHGLQPVRERSERRGALALGLGPTRFAQQTREATRRYSCVSMLRIELEEKKNLVRGFFLFE